MLIETHESLLSTYVSIATCDLAIKLKTLKIGRTVDTRGIMSRSRMNDFGQKQAVLIAKATLDFQTNI